MNLRINSSEVDRSGRNEHLSELRFTQLTEDLICTATANRTLPSDALAALAKALGTLLAFTARREGLAEEDILKASQNAVADYATSAARFMRINSELDPAANALNKERLK